MTFGWCRSFAPSTSTTWASRTCSSAASSSPRSSVCRISRSERVRHSLQTHLRITRSLGRIVVDGVCVCVWHRVALPVFLLWMQFLGFSELTCTTVTAAALSSLELGRYFPVLKIEEFVAPQDFPFMSYLLPMMSQCSSVAVSCAWIRDAGFPEYAQMFVQYNAPFYALPLMTIFNLYEMGIVDCEPLLKALASLKDTPAYRVKGSLCAWRAYWLLARSLTHLHIRAAVSYWVRDIGFERHMIKFAKFLLVDFIEALTILTDATIHSLIDDEDDRELLKVPFLLLLASAAAAAAAARSSPSLTFNARHTTESRKTSSTMRGAPTGRDGAPQRAALRVLCTVVHECRASECNLCTSWMSRKPGLLSLMIDALPQCWCCCYCWLWP